MKIWFDTEFIEDGKTIDLISIGMIREDGQMAYWESSECDHSKASDWVKENVLPHLVGVQHNRITIANEILEFAGINPEFWAYFADYDWVALCQLYGTMMDLPAGWPMFCMDIQQVKHEKRVRELPAMTTTEHNALNDAIWARDAYLFLTNPINHE